MFLHSQIDIWSVKSWHKILKSFLKIWLLQFFLSTYFIFHIFSLFLLGSLWRDYKWKALLAQGSMSNTLTVFFCGQKPQKASKFLESLGIFFLVIYLLPMAGSQIVWNNIWKKYHVSTWSRTEFEPGSVANW